MVVYDRVLPNQANETLYALAIGVAIAVLFDQLLKRARSGIIEYSATASDRHISNEIFEQFVDVRVRTARSVGSLSTVIKDFETYKDFVTSATILAFIDLPFIFIFIYVISVVGAELYLIPLICIPIVIVGVLVIQPLLYKSSKKLSDANKSRQGYLVELLSGLDVLRINGAFAELRKRFVRESRNFSVASARAKNLGQISGNIVYVVQQFSQVGVIVFGFHLFITQDITMGAIIATMILSGKTLAPLAKLAQTLSKLNSALIARGNLKAFLSQRRKNIVSENGIFEVSHKRGLRIDNVTLRLADGAKPVFTQLSLSIEQGEKVAIIGKSGSGKTSLIKLFCGLNEPEVGTAFVDGVDATCIDRADVFKKIGVCFQDPWIFAGSIRENIALGQEEITDNEIINALRLAGGDALGNDLSTILDGICADRGSNLSGGQKQIIALARSLVFNADYLLLDEPTSSMDATMEAQVINNINSKLTEKTVVVVTHKPNLLNACDRIIVLEAGRKVWDGKRQDYVKLVNERKAAS
jgi:ATP-binding cassette subfamily C protein LapB